MPTADETMDSEKIVIEYKYRPSLVIVIVRAAIYSLSFAAVSPLVTMYIVPHRFDGIRNVPNVSWSTYASIGNLIPILSSLIVIGYIFQTTRDRMVGWGVVAVFCYIAHAAFLTGMLRRYFIGKF